jgi:hypothetical protein
MKTVTRLLRQIFEVAVDRDPKHPKNDLSQTDIYQLSIADLVRTDRVARHIGMGMLFTHLRMTESEISALRVLSEMDEPIRIPLAGKKGVRKDVIYSLVRKGALLKLCPGVFRPYSAQDPENMDHFLLFAQCPKAVICLVSALSVHELTDEIPSEIHVSIPSRSRIPELHWPPVKFHQYSQESFLEGIEERELGGAMIRIYSKEKSIADCFKFADQIGRDVALEALKRYIGAGGCDIDLLLKCARTCRVEKKIHPYLEVLLEQ